MVMETWVEWREKILKFAEIESTTRPVIKKLLRCLPQCEELFCPIREVQNRNGGWACENIEHVENSRLYTLVRVYYNNDSMIILKGYIIISMVSKQVYI